MLLLMFTAGGNQYAVDVARVVELVPRVELRKVPHAPVFLAGLLGYRGKVVPVIDLGLLLDGGPCRDCLSTRIIVVNDSPGHQNRWNQHRESSHEQTRKAPAISIPAPNLLGLIAEQVSDLTYIRSEQIIPAPVQLPQTSYLGPIVQTDLGLIVQLIIIEKIREASLQSSHPRPEPALDL
jgi:chemotaxis-related protein WspB